MKLHKRLMQSIAAVANPISQKSKAWRAAHPVTAGLVPLVPYVPPSGHGAKFIAPNSPNAENKVETNLARVSIVEFA